MAVIDDIQSAIDKLSSLLDSDAYMEMLNAPNTSAEDEAVLQGAFQRRSQLVQELLGLYAQQIDENTPQFTALVDQMNSVATVASTAVSTLNTYTDRVAAAVQVASALDSVLKQAMALAA